MRKRHGFTLVELIFILLVSAILLLIAAPPLNRARHLLAVRAARAELTAAVAATRSAAVLSGGAALVIDPATGTAWIEMAGTHLTGAEYPLAARYGVRLGTDRNVPLTLRFDALGIGRLANASLAIRRGSEEASLTISAYGRVRQ